MSGQSPHTERVLPTPLLICGTAARWVHLSLRLQAHPEPRLLARVIRAVVQRGLRAGVPPSEPRPESAEAISPGRMRFFGTKQIQLPQFAPKIYRGKLKALLMFLVHFRSFHDTRTLVAPRRPVRLRRLNS